MRRYLTNHDFRQHQVKIPMALPGSCFNEWLVDRAGGSPHLLGGISMVPSDTGWWSRGEGNADSG